MSYAANMDSAMTFVCLVLALGIMVDARHLAASELTQREKMLRRGITATPIPTAKVTSGTMVVTPSSIADKGKHASSVADTGTLLSSKADTGTPANAMGNKDTPVSSIVDSGTPGRSLADTDTTASAMGNLGTPVSSIVNSGAHESSVADKGTPSNRVDQTGIAAGNQVNHHEAVTKLKLQLQELERMRQQLQTEIVTGSFSKRKEQVLSHIQRQILLREKQILELTETVPDKNQHSNHIETNLVQKHQQQPLPPPPLQQQQQEHYQQYQHHHEPQQQLQPVSKLQQLQSQEMFHPILPNTVQVSNTNSDEKKILITGHNKETTLINDFKSLNVLSSGIQNQNPMDFQVVQNQNSNAGTMMLQGKPVNYPFQTPTGHTLVNDFQSQNVLSGGIQNQNPIDFQAVQNQNTNAGTMMIQGNRAVNMPFQTPTGHTFNNNLVLPSNDINQYRQSGNNNIFTGTQMAGPQHILVPINTLSLDNIIQRQMFPSERYIIINKASPDTATNEQLGSKRTGIEVKTLSTAAPVQTTLLPKPKTTTEPQPTEATTQSDEEPQPPPSTVIPPTTPSADPGSPNEVEEMKKHLLQVELKKQQLEIRKLNLEIRALQREETNMFSNMGGESEDGPQRRRLGFGARPMPFPFFK